MTDFQSVGPADLEEGDLQAFNVDGEKVAVAKVEGKLYAFGDECTHEGCLLSTGDLSGTSVECPCHGSQFDVTTGAVLEGPAEEPVPSYDVREEGGELQVGL